MRLHEGTWIFFRSNQVMFICVLQLSATTDWKSEMQVVFLLLLTHHRYGPYTATYMEMFSIRPTWAVVLNAFCLFFYAFLLCIMKASKTGTLGPLPALKWMKCSLWELWVSEAGTLGHLRHWDSYFLVLKQGPREAQQRTLSKYLLLHDVRTS